MGGGAPPARPQRRGAARGRHGGSRTRGADDKKNYRRTDEALARKLSGEITIALGVTATPDQTTWKSLQARAFVVLKKHYEEAIRLGRFLYYYEDAETLFPSLFTASRAAPSRGDKAVEAPKEGVGAPEKPTSPAPA